MKTFDYIAPIAEVQRVESRRIRTLGIRVNWNCMVQDVDGRQFAPRPDPITLSADDTDWGETDSLANVPRRVTHGWVAAALATGGDE